MRFRLYLCCAGRFGLLPLMCLSLHAAQAGSATWKLDPVDGDWENPANWEEGMVPNGPDDIATLADSNELRISFSTDLEVSEIVFNAGRRRFTINSVLSAVLTISGAGITNTSGQMQKLVVKQNDCCAEQGEVRFTNNATAGVNTTLIGRAGTKYLYGSGGAITFYDQASADHSVIQVYGMAARAYLPGYLRFYDNSTAGNAVISTLGIPGGEVATLIFFSASTAGNATINIGRVGISGGRLYFFSTANAGTSQITNNGYLGFDDSASLSQGTITNIPNSTNGYYTGSVNFSSDATAATGTVVNQGGTATGMNGAATHFIDTSAAGSATLIAQAGSNGGGGGFISFEAVSDGGQARAEIYGNGTLDISLRDFPGITIGSLIGDGSVFVGGNTLTIGSNNESIGFDGVIHDGGENGGTGGALTKIGTGRLILTNANTYTGGTTVDGGTLLANNTTGSGFGSGPVQALSGILGGSGVISGGVTMGTGRGTGITLAPGANSVVPGTLTIGKQLALSSDATYRVTLDSDTPAADLVIAKGIRIIGAQIAFIEVGSASLPPGMVLTVISNTSRKPISGTFANLSDGGSITVGGNTFQANYEGGDGNDLTLTVVP